MKLIKPSYQIISALDAVSALNLIEDAGRTCYKSEDKKTPESAIKFTRMILNRQHESVIEHGVATVRFIIDRGVSHELVRHRLASFSQESTRYCNYSKNKFDQQITYIIPPWLTLTPGTYRMDENADIYREGSQDTFEKEYNEWLYALLESERTYMYLTNECKWQPQRARSVLPNALKTEIVVTANFREWRTIFKQRCAAGAHEQMREVMVPLYNEMNALLPSLFDDIKVEKF